MALFIDFDLPPVLCLLLEKTQPAEEMVDGGYDLSEMDPSSDICFKPPWVVLVSSQSVGHTRL